MSYNRRRYTSSSSVIDTETIYDVDQQKLQSEINAEFQEGIDSKVDTEEGKGLSTNDYTTEEKSKLAGIEAQANKYVHPSQTSRTGKPTANQTPAFGGSFSVSQVKNDDQGHVTALTERTVTIPDTSATSTAKGLVVLSDDLTDTTPAATGGKAPSMKAVSDLNGAINSIDSALAIVANGNTHAYIAQGQYVYVKGHSTLAEGLYQASTNISANATLTTSNLKAVSNGGFNAVGAQAHYDIISNIGTNNTGSVSLDTIGKIAIVTSYIGEVVSGGASSGWVIVGSIPSGLRPSANVTGIAFSYSGSGITKTYTARVTSGGSVQIMALQNGDTGIAFTLPYIIA